MVRTRFAPSPTGYMHIGNLRTALYAYLYAKKHNGSFILRIEDTDQERLVEGAIPAIYRSLATAGLRHDEGPDVGGAYGPYVQSERKAQNTYMEYAKQLIKDGYAYYCFCTEEEIEEQRKNAEGTYKYDGRCSRLTDQELTDNLATKSYVIRIKMPTTGELSFDDSVYGTISAPAADLDDMVLIKSDGMPTYNFANVIDDHLMGITHVIRGSEYLSSTPKYNFIYRALGWDPPTYMHLPPVMADKTRKMSKRHGDPSFEDLLNQGYLPEAIVNYIALLGWNPGTTQEIFTLDELIETFSVKGVNASPAVFDIKKLQWMNAQYIKAMNPDEFKGLAYQWLSEGMNVDSLNLDELCRLLQPRIAYFAELKDQVSFINGVDEYDLSLLKSKKDPLEYKEILPILNINGFSDCGWSREELQRVVQTIAETQNRKPNTMLWSLRIALTGKEVTPGGFYDLAMVFGKHETLKRLIDTRRRIIERG